MIPLQPLQTLRLDVPHTRTLCLGLWAAHFVGQGTKTMLSRKLHPDPFDLQTSPEIFLLCHQMKRHRKALWWAFSTCHQPWE